MSLASFEQVSVSREWFSRHRDEWETLLPTGEGVGFSLAAGQNGEPRERR